MAMKSARAIPTKRCSVLSETCIAMLFGLTILCGSFVMLTRPVFAAGISPMTPKAPSTGFCGNSVGGHCYAVRDWVGYTGGANVLINPFGALSCFGCASGGFIDDEMWYTGDNGVSMIEVGISTWPANDANNCNQGVDSVCGFWGDVRTGGGNHLHPLYWLGNDGVSLNPYLFYADIVNSTSNSSNGNTWTIQTFVYQNGVLVADLAGLSTNNPMNGHDIQIGSELSDSRGSAGVVDLQDNQWLDSSNGGWFYQTTAGTNHSTGGPPNGFWQTTPCNCSGNTGGSFQTSD